MELGTPPAGRARTNALVWVPLIGLAAVSAWQAPTLLRYFTPHVLAERAALLWPHFRATFLEQPFIPLVAAVCLLERWRPARPEQPAWSLANTHDLVWMIAHLWFEVTVIALFYVHLADLYASSVGFSFDLDGHLPVVAAVLVAFVVSDMVGWFAHRQLHVVRPLWNIHAVHHSQTRMNIFTTKRVHVAEFLVVAVIQFVPLALMGVDTRTIFWLAASTGLWQELCHANVRFGFGPVRHVLITPQSHRVHHSIEERHFDTNFGVVLSVWDRLFGTRSPDVESYPATGIVDDFPLEQRASVGGVLSAYVAQLLYPFRATWALARRDS